MQGELTDSGTHLLSQSSVSHAAEPPAPNVGAESAFNQALSASSSPTQVNAVNEVDVGNQINNFQFPRLGEITEASGNHLSMRDLDHSDWNAKQLLNSARFDNENNASLIDKSMGYVQGLESQRRESMSDFLNIDKHMKPLLDLTEAIEAKRNNEPNTSLFDMTPEERMHQIQTSVQEIAMDNMELQSVSTKVQGEMSAASMKASYSMAIFSAVKEVSVGLVGLVKNIINNTR